MIDDGQFQVKPWWTPPQLSTKYAGFVTKYAAIVKPLDLKSVLIHSDSVQLRVRMGQLTEVDGASSNETFLQRCYRRTSCDWTAI